MNVSSQIVSGKDRSPLPRIDNLIDRLHGATVFRSLGLQCGYHQIRIEEEDRHKTAFITDKGFQHLPFVVVY